MIGTPEHNELAYEGGGGVEAIRALLTTSVDQQQEKS